MQTKSNTSTQPMKYCSAVGIKTTLSSGYININLFNKEYSFFTCNFFDQIITRTTKTKVGIVYMYK